MKLKNTFQTFIKFITAVSEGSKVGAIMVLGDQDIDITLSLHWEMKGKKQKKEVILQLNLLL